MQFEEAPLFPHVDGSTPDPKKAEARLNKWEIDLSSNSGTIKKEYLDDEIGEFPRLDERFSMLNYRHGYFATKKEEDHPEGISFNAIAHYDHQTGKKNVYGLSKYDAVGEPIFVPKTRDSEEGEGYLIALAYKGRENISELMILDAQQVEKGPIGKALLPHRIPYGFHGNWREG